jgi:hypothetical protein
MRLNRQSLTPPQPRQFLAHSLSELSREHALALLKLESSRAHCEELAVELRLPTASLRAHVHMSLNRH